MLNVVVRHRREASGLLGGQSPVSEDKRGADVLDLTSHVVWDFAVHSCALS